MMLTVLTATTAVAQTQQITTTEAKNLYQTKNKTYVSIHDPSVVWEPKTKRYYIIGSHKAGAYSSDMQNWTQANPKWQAGSNTNAANKDAFVTPAVKKVKKGGVEVDFPQFDAVAWSALGGTQGGTAYSVDGNMWAPDVIWNPTMEKWCMYLSINGDNWMSSIILLTSSNITGPYVYQGPVVISGFKNGTTYKSTDLELVLGTLSSLPSRYNHTSNTNGQKYGDWWPNNIDPCVFYDENGELWIAYGSWSGGIWMLKLNKENGLRDYDTTYPSDYDSKGKGMTSDPYFGKRIAGGYYVSGEGPYIEHIGNYYYLFMSYGGFAPDGGYEMRVFRSSNPDGPYKDASGRTATFDKWVQNYGTSSDNRGEKIMGAYDHWGFMSEGTKKEGEISQGHNSIIAAEDGRTYLVYHTKFNDGTLGHLVRVHQVFQNKQGWLVAAPFEYNGETVTDADIASKQLIANSDIPGTYQLLVHKYKMDYGNLETVEPVEVTLTADGKVTGSYTGTWTIDEGTSYITVKLGGVTYNGVIYEQQMDRKNIKTVSFTAMATTGVNIWGYKLAPKYAVAWQVNNQTLPVTNGKSIDENYDLDAMWLDDPNVTVSWTSDNPAIISEHGRYNPAGLAENTFVTLDAKVSSGDWYWTQQLKVSAKSEASSIPTADWQTGLDAHYGFDDTELANTYDNTQKAQLKRKGTTKLPTLETGDNLRNGQMVHLSAGANAKESYVAFPNPLKGKDLASGATIAFWVKLTSENVWDALFGVTDGTAHFYLTGNAYIGYNSGTGNWIDINHPNETTTNYIPSGKWHFIEMVIKNSALTLYVDGTSKSHKKIKGTINGTDFTAASKFDYSLMLNLLKTADELNLGSGSFWGSPNALFDDVIIYSRALSTAELAALKKMANRVGGIGNTTTGITNVNRETITNNRYYDLQGRRVSSPKPGLYIVNGKKVVIK